MKLKKIVKYNYTLTEETLEKDIDKFIENAKNGDFHMDKMYQNEGLKIIKQYFRILKEKFKNNEFEECKICYHKLIPFLLVASSGENDLFDYNDLLAKITSEFDDYIKNYFICLVKTCSIDELTDKIFEYASALDIYGFDSDFEVLLNNLSKEQLNEFEEKMLMKLQSASIKEENRKSGAYFLIEMSEHQENKERYLKLCERLKGVLMDEEIVSLKEEYKDYALSRGKG
ncbi:MAG: hypothetical protein AABX11_06030 [Nanoarchaeota archaeon]